MEQAEQAERRVVVAGPDRGGPAPGEPGGGGGGPGRVAPGRVDPRVEDEDRAVGPARPGRPATVRPAAVADRDRLGQVAGPVASAIAAGSRGPANVGTCRRTVATTAATAAG